MLTNQMFFKLVCSSFCYTFIRVYTNFKANVLTVY